jgi:hypothetical protein
MLVRNSTIARLREQLGVGPRCLASVGFGTMINSLSKICYNKYIDGDVLSERNENPNANSISRIIPIVTPRTSTFGTLSFTEILHGVSFY